MVLATYRSGVYNVLLLLHILAAIVGFGGVVLNGIYAAQANKRGGREGLAVSEANEFVSSKVAERAIYAVFVLGILLLIVGRPVVKFSQGWVITATVLYLIGLGTAQSVMVPGHRRLNRLMDELTSASAPSGGAQIASGPPPQVAEIEALGKRLAATGAFLNLVLVVIVFLMVFKPGGVSV